MFEFNFDKFYDEIRKEMLKQVDTPENAEYEVTEEELEDGYIKVTKTWRAPGFQRSLVTVRHKEGTLAQLKKRKQEAIQEENYEEASRLRDQIAKLEEENKKKE